VDNNAISLILIVSLILVVFYKSQTKFRDKMLCTFIRPNKMKIEVWVPLYSKYIVFDRGKYGIGQYICDPRKIITQWYTRGINKLFPYLIPTLEFKWDTPNPLDPETWQSTWYTPETMNAAWQEHQHQDFAKGVSAQMGQKKRFPDWFFPVITLVVVLAILYYVYTTNTAMQSQLNLIQQQLKVK
jgi:hypothetical protein